MITKIIDCVEETISDGEPYTLFLAILWMVVGWPLYILRPIEEKLRK